MLSLPALHSRVLAEFVGTFALIAVGVGAILNGGGGLVGVAFAHGLTIAVMVTAVGHISGGHFNPAVTVTLLALRKIAPVDALAYIVAQLAGGIAGAAVLKVAFDERWTDKAASMVLAPGVSAGQGFLLEALTTFFLVWVVFAVAVDRDGAFFKVAGMPIGFTVVLDILMIGPLTGGAMNPARYLGPAVMTGEFSNCLVWLGGSIVGGLVAGFLYMYGIKPREADAA